MLLTIAALAVFTTACEKEDEEPSKAVVKGKVTESGTSIVNADVGLRSLSYSKQFERITVTDGTGSYQFSGLPRGDYELGARWTNATNNVCEGGARVQINMGYDVVIGDIVLTCPTSGGGGSCPYVYTFGGDSYHFNGDIYAGAIYPSLERNDFLPLTGLKQVNGQYQLKITNELKERQYTNLAELMIVNHPKNTQILFDKYGNAQSLSDKHTPLSAMTVNNLDYVNYISKKDGIAYLFNETDDEEQDWIERIMNLFTTQKKGVSSLILTFEKPDNTDKGKLVINAKNSEWSVYIYKQLIELFGNYYNEWREDQKILPAKEHIKWQLEQGVPILVYLETEKGWEYVDYFNLVGSMKARDMVLPIDLSEVASDFIKVKLECGFMFWELDYTVMV